MKTNKKNVWFPAKRYGFGWGLPVTWQGWVVLLSYIFLVTIGGLVLADPAGPTAYFFPYLIVMTALFVFVCWKKGEKPQWRWGNKK